MQISTYPILKRSSLVAKISILTLSVALASCTNNNAESLPKEQTTEALSSHSSDNSESDSNTTNAPSPESDATVVAALEENFKKSGFDQKIYSAVPTSMENIYWVTAEGLPAFYSDKQGRHIIQGDIVEIGQPYPIDISASLKANKAKEKLSAVNEDELIIYPANGETKAVVYIFTDADCPYCTKLHSEMDTINNMGVEVRYLAWPRSEASIPKMEAIWCSSDRIEAMNKAKSGKPVSAANCENPVQSHVELGMKLGVSGTPAIFTESGHQIGGYIPAQQLAQSAIND